MVGSCFECSPRLAGGNRLLCGRKSDGLEKQRGALFDLGGLNSMIDQQGMQSVSRLGIQTSSKNPRTGHASDRVQVSDKEGTTSGMKLECLSFGSWQHLAAKHHVNEPQRTNPTQALGSEIPVDNVSSESTRPNSSSNALMQHGKPGWW